LGVEPDFLFGSVEYRTDVPWACAWLGVLAVLVSGRLSKGRAFVAGLLAGIALVVSMNTSLLIAAAGAGAIVTWPARRNGEGAPLARVATYLLAAAAGLVVVPMSVIAAFAHLGALKPLVQCTVGYNVLPGLGLWGVAPLRPLGWFAGAPLVIGAATWTQRREPWRNVAHRRALLLASTGLAHLAIETVWPLVVRGDMLPLRPVESIFLAAVLVAVGSSVSAAMPRVRAILPFTMVAAVVLGELIATIHIGDLGHDGTRTERYALADVLHLTRLGDPVMNV